MIKITEEFCWIRNSITVVYFQKIWWWNSTWQHCCVEYVQVNLCQKLFFLQNMGRTCCVQKLFWMSETISVHNMFSPGLSLEFNEQSVVILWVSWCKNKSFWQRFTCTTYPLLTWSSLDFLRITYLPLIVHEVIEWPHGDHGAIKLLLDAKVPAAVNGRLLQRSRAVGTKRGWEGNHPLQILSGTFDFFLGWRSEQIVSNTSLLKNNDNIYKKHSLNVMDWHNFWLWPVNFPIPYIALSGRKSFQSCFIIFFSSF